METELIVAALFVLALIALDLLALRRGRDSRQPFDERRNWF